ncbi:MAG: tRNA pseudouridine(55) synthase TruB [Candidatus Margulisbacteria bacterium]|nr:tRNA pseudouridine(55) synthase TruB [Candidatus Margulisiibacteriota bacterium]
MLKSSIKENPITKFQEGIWLVNKPQGWTSFDVVAKIRALTGIKKVGHAGTLDPAAEGLLIIAVGKKYTKQIESYLNLDKEYLAEITLGIRTDSGDRDGIVLEENKVQVKRAMVEQVVAGLVGVQEQIPPMYSALKIAGKKLYNLARQGLEVERKARKIEIKKAELIDFTEDNFPKLKIKILCSKGTYIRVLAEKIGEILKTGAFLSGLIRTKIGDYNVENSVSILNNNY